MYESALAELKANQPDAVAQYDALFGSNVPTTRSTGQGGFRGSANVGITATPTPMNTFKPDYDSPHFQTKAHLDQISPTSTVSESDNAYRNLKPTRDYSVYNSPGHPSNYVSPTRPIVTGKGSNPLGYSMGK